MDLMQYLFIFIVLVGVLLAVTAFIIVVDKLLGDQSAKIITINDDTQIEVYGDDTVLNTLADNKIYLPSSCGGKGTCGTCTFRLVEGGTPMKPVERAFINAKAEAEGVRLSCQVRVSSDLKIVLPPGLMDAAVYKTKIAKLTDLTYDIKLVKFTLIEPNVMEFKPGQFIQIKIPGIDVVRAYSIASDPADTSSVELMIRLVPKGAATTFIHKALMESDSLEIDGPFGDFYLNEQSNKDIICIAGGSGMAPIRSILYRLEAMGMKRKVKYFFGARTQKDLYLTDELMEISKRFPNFTYIPALSHADDDETWKGEKGLITDVVRKLSGNLKDSEAYLCGSPGMIDACINVLKDLEMPEEEIRFDKF